VVPLQFFFLVISSLYNFSVFYLASARAPLFYILSDVSSFSLMLSVSGCNLGAIQKRYFISFLPPFSDAVFSYDHLSKASAELLCPDSLRRKASAKATHCTLSETSPERHTRTYE
jgi:hypothetical protein